MAESEWQLSDRRGVFTNPEVAPRQLGEELGPSAPSSLHDRLIMAYPDGIPQAGIEREVSEVFRARDANTRPGTFGIGEVGYGRRTEAVEEVTRLTKAERRAMRQQGAKGKKSRKG